MPEQKTQTFRGTVENVKNVNTRSGRKMITFEMTGYPFKAFGEQAEAIEQVEGQHVEITAKHNTFRGKDEYAVVTIIANETPSSKGTVTGAHQNLRHNDRPNCVLSRYGSDLKARGVGAWLNDFFDGLTDEEWRQWQIPKYKRFGIFPATDEEAETRRTWRDTSTSPPRPPQDLESVKTRFNARLDLVREDLRLKATAQVSKACFTPIDESAPNCP
jgi:hypothetical protein